MGESKNDSNAVVKKALKKKVLYFIPRFPVLTETFIEREVSKLVDLGNLDIVVVSMAKGEGAISENLKNKVHYERLTLEVSFAAAVKHILLHPKKFLTILKLVQGQDTVPFFPTFAKKDDERSKISVLGRFAHARLVHFFKGIAYAKVFEKYRPDHIHVHFLSDVSTIAMVAAKFLNVSFSVSAHAFDIFIDGSLIATKAAYAKFIAICNGTAWQRVVDLANKTKSSGKVRLIYHGIDESKLLDAEPAQVDVDAPVILTVARLVEKKGLDYLIDASKILFDRGVGHKIFIIGGGPLYQSLKAKVAQFGLESHIEILGEGKGLPHQEVKKYLKRANIFVFPAIQSRQGDMDGVPTAVIEASLAKVPIISTDAGSITDLINSQSGILVAQQNAGAIADAIDKLTVNPEMGRDLAENAYNKAKEMFDIDKNVKELERLLL